MVGKNTLPRNKGIVILCYIITFADFPQLPFISQPESEVGQISELRSNYSGRISNQGPMNGKFVVEHANLNLTEVPASMR